MNFGDNLPSISREFAKDVPKICQNFAEMFFLDFHRNGFLLVDANFLKHFFFVLIIFISAHLLHISSVI